MTRKLSTTIHQFLTGLIRQQRDERAASLVEYGFLVALIAIVCLVAILFFGEDTSESFSSTSESIRNV